MGKVYYREQKHICGRDYETAPYMEVDLYPVTYRQHKASRRAKRKEAKVNPVRKGAQARRQAAKAVREQRNAYFRQQAIEKSIEKARERQLHSED